jgi:hypothetical protein
MTRRRELVIAAAAIGLAASFAAAALVLRFFDPVAWVEWPPLPGTEGWAAFNLYFWIVPVTLLLAVPLLFVASRRRHLDAPVLGALVCLQTAMLYLPLAAAIASRVDRLRGFVLEPVPEMRQLVVMVVLTLVLAVVYAFARRALHALVIAAVLSGVLLQLHWLFLFLPPAAGWWPHDWRRADLLVPLRPCRGAMVWHVDDGHVFPEGRIDDVWRRFDDPRAGRPVQAISVRGEWRLEYIWLSGADLTAVRVRADDPALARCDATARRERVAPAAWHQVGLSSHR